MTVEQILALMRLIADQEMQITALQSELAATRAELERANAPKPPAAHEVPA